MQYIIFPLSKSVPQLALFLNLAIAQEISESVMGSKTKELEMGAGRKEEKSELLVVLLVFENLLASFSPTVQKFELK